MLHTIDYFRALINDPFVFGQISANHCLIFFAMGAMPDSALAIATTLRLEAKSKKHFTNCYQALSRC